MTSETVVSEDVKALVKKIITEQNLKGVTDVKYECAASEGYLSKALIADIIHEGGQLNLFLKCGLDIGTPYMPVERNYESEIIFYREIHPAMAQFCEEKGVEDYFRQIPKFYGSVNYTVALENLRKANFEQCIKTEALNDNHMELALKTFAKFHGTSYAFKDQRRAQYDALTGRIYDFFSEYVELCGFHTLTKNTLKFFFSQLDPTEDKLIVDNLDGLEENLLESMSSAKGNLKEYAILSQSDSHCNNMMFLYVDDHKQIPRDIRLIDWQTPRIASPVYDLAYFFYNSASKKHFDNYEYYLNLYHEELSKTVRSLGSDPEIVYPYKQFRKEWKEWSKYGVGWGCTVIRLITSDKDEAMSFGDLGKENAREMKDIIVPNLKREKEFRVRFKMAIEHLIKNDFL